MQQQIEGRRLVIIFYIIIVFTMGIIALTSCEKGETGEPELAPMIDTINKIKVTIEILSKDSNSTSLCRMIVFLKDQKLQKDFLNNYKIISILDTVYETGDTTIILFMPVIKNMIDETMYRNAIGTAVGWYSVPEHQWSHTQVSVYIEDNLDPADHGSGLCLNDYRPLPETRPGVPVITWHSVSKYLPPD